MKNSTRIFRHLLAVFTMAILAVAYQPVAARAATSASPLPAEEIVILAGKEYPVPEQWKGMKITPIAIAPSSFSQIPTRYTKDGSKLFITQEACTALIRLLKQAESENVLLQVESGYRSVRYQRIIFKRMLANGRTFEDIVRYVAPPGYSEHALGKAVDFFPSNWRFADLPQYRWLSENAHKFGFTETYSKNNSRKLPWEAWHWSYTEDAHE